MIISTKKNLFIFLFIAVTVVIQTNAQQLAFPGAGGYGRFASGGRGGVVLEVTNLNDSGPGSLREAISAYTEGQPRTIVFRVSGRIILESPLDIARNDITIAGQTAPGDGITISNYVVQMKANNVILRYMRFRLGDETQLEADAIGGTTRTNIIIDHCSMSWSIDEVASFYTNRDFTLQYCIISESLYDSYHSKGEHGYGGIWGGWGATFHHNLFAHHTSRTPRFEGARNHGIPENEIVDFANNVIYNWGFNSAYGGEGGNFNMRRNYYKYGPATKSGVRYRIVEPSDTSGNWYVDSNFVYGSESITADNWNGGVQGAWSVYQKNKKALTPFPIAEVETQTAEDAYLLVLENAGANIPARDSIDMRILEEVSTGTAQYGSSFEGGGNGIIDSQEDVGGFPVLRSSAPPPDEDHDGMDDIWETENGLDPGDPDDRNIVGDDGYTMLEKYLNGLADGTIVSTGEDLIIPETFEVHGNYPNPFNPSTHIDYSIPYRGRVAINIYNSAGQLIEKLYDGYQPAGRFRIKWQSRNAASGFYVASISYSGKVKTIKMLLIK